MTRLSILLFVLGALTTVTRAQTPGLTPGSGTADSISPVFRNDSTSIEKIRAVEAGVQNRDSVRSSGLALKDSLRLKLKNRGPYVGVTVGAAFAEHSARDRFSAAMANQALADSQRTLRGQDPVHVFFPVGLLVGIPIFSYLDLILRSEHFYYRVAGLAQKDNEPASEYWYTNQAHLAGVGLRGYVPVSFLTVTGQSGLYVGYTHFWSFGPTGIRSPDGNVAARFSPAGAGMEIQTGFQQDFNKRWALTGGLAWSRLSFKSDADWTNVAPAASTPGERADWTLTSMRFALQGLYQFGRMKSK